MQYYNSDEMRELRSGLLDGKQPTGCSTCYYEDSFGKLSGRKRQLLKSGIQLGDFDLTARASSHYSHFQYSHAHTGTSDYRPTDLQIDLGNTCNSACIMCTPEASSRLQQDYRKLHNINPVQFANVKHYTSWTRDPVLLDRVVNEIVNIEGIKYIHFLGGETLYDPAFYTICERLVAAGRAKDIIVGTTTNGTIYDARIEKLITQFQEFHLGISIESVTELNDYVRYPSCIQEIKQNIESFLKLRDESKLYVSLRITPNVFTASELDQLFEYMIQHQVIAESCNILYNPALLRVELMPEDIRQETIDRLNLLIARHQLEKSGHANIRKTDIIQDVIADVVVDYRNFIRDYAPLPEVDALRRQLASFLKSFDTLRNNSVIDYAPRYKHFLRSHGY